MTYSSLPTPRLRAVENSLRMLLNDMNTVVEARCAIHGVGGGTTANATAGLLPCIGIEIIAQREGSGSIDTNLRDAFVQIARVTSYSPYSRVGFPVFKILRNGLAHGFYPNEAPSINGPSVTAIPTFWVDQHTGRSICVREIGPRLESGHLVPLVQEPNVILRVCAQHWCNDIRMFIEEFLTRLQGDHTLQGQVEANDERLERTASHRLREQVTEADTIALGI